MEEQGVTEERAYAICNASIDNLDKINDSKPLRMNDASFETSIDPETGFMHIKGTIARTGIQKYYGYELGNEEAPMEVFNVYRPKEEVLSEESLKSFTNTPATDDHPPEFVNIDNYIDYACGSMSNTETYEKDGIDYIKTDVVITSRKLIEKINGGKVELSVGYTQDLKQESGEFMGEKYDYVQTNIRANHIAVVSQGRCGSSCRLTPDEKSVTIISENQNNKELDLEIEINGEMFEVSEAVAAEIEALRSKLAEMEAEETSEEEPADEEPKEEPSMDMEEDPEKSKDSKTVDEMQATIDALKDKIENLEKSSMNDSDIFAAAAKRADMIALAKENGITVDATMDCLTIKKAILSKNGVLVDGKAVEYIDARLDIMMEDKQSVKKDLDNLADELNDSTVVTDEATLRNERIEARRNKFQNPNGGNK